MIDPASVRVSREANGHAGTTLSVQVPPERNSALSSKHCGEPNIGAVRARARPPNP